LASNFSDEPQGGNALPAAAPAPDTQAGSPAAPTADLSPAVAKFRSCRWRRPPEDGSECCTHRDVMPIAGTGAFNAEAWCPDCEYFKLRRAPRKRVEREENGYW